MLNDENRSKHQKAGVKENGASAVPQRSVTNSRRRVSNVARVWIDRAAFLEGAHLRRELFAFCPLMLQKCAVR